MAEMSTSKIPQDIGEEPPARISARPAPQPKPLAKRTGPAVHKHPARVHDVVAGIDPDGRRIIREVPDRTATYMFDCSGCVAEDKARMAAPPSATEEDLDLTVFLIPEPDYDGSVARAYIKARYPGGKRNIVNAIDCERLSYVKGARIVVITRRTEDGVIPGPSSKRSKDEEGVFQNFPIPPETYIGECIESEAIMVEDCMSVKAATMLSVGSVDLTELIARLAEVAFPYRIALPADPRDKLYVMRLNS